MTHDIPAAAISIGDIGPASMTGAPVVLGAPPGVVRLLLGRTLPSGYPVIWETSGLEQLDALDEASARARAQVIRGQAREAGLAVAP